MKRALLVSMPFGASTRPSIGLGLLKAALVRDHIACDVRYFNIRFAARIGTELYERIGIHGAPRLPGEWVFSGELFGDKIPPAERYFAELLRAATAECSEQARPGLCSPVSGPELLQARAQVGPFLDECLAAIAWDEYALVGFGTVFQQNTASLALARRLKTRYPHLAIVFGGASCDGEMGIALHRLFPFIDYVCSGEADLTFPLLARRILEGQPVGHIAGVTQRIDGRSVPPTVAGAPVSDMDSLPIPDYEEFLQQRTASNVQSWAPPQFQIETARGCWWGEKSHCTFCGLNRATMKFRAKSPARALAELTALVQRYQVRYLAATDNIIDMRYFRDVLPRLAQLDLEVELFYETKANLRKEQVRVFRDAGIVLIQPGIESLSNNVLRLMRKGVSALQNIQLLRWCAEYMVLPRWNLLAGFPGEDPADYARQAEIVPLLTHLPPPDGLNLVRLDRFSPLFVHAEAMGLRNVRAARAYSYMYPFSADDLSSIAYFFDFDYADSRDPASYLGQLKREVTAWTSRENRGQLTSLVDDNELVICDTRSVAVRDEYRLRGLSRTVYEFCDQARSRAAIEAHVSTLPAEQCADADLDSVLAELVASKLMLYEHGRYLSLAVAADFQVDCLVEQLARRRGVPDSMRPALARLSDPRARALKSLFNQRLAARLSFPFAFTAIESNPRAEPTIPQ